MTALSPEELAEVETRAEAAKQAFLSGDRGLDDFYAIAASSADVPELLAALDAAEERAQAAEGALARVEGLIALEESTPGAVDGLLSSIREAMEGKP